jgi:hypothetical protein
MVMTDAGPINVEYRTSHEVLEVSPHVEPRPCGDPGAVC